LIAVFCIGIFWTSVSGAVLEGFPVAEGRAVDVSGSVVELVERRTDYLTELSAIEDPAEITVFVLAGSAADWQGRMLIFARDYDVALGDELHFVAQVQANDSYSNWYVQNSEHYLRDQGIGAALSVIPGTLHFTAFADLSLWQRMTFGIKEKVYAAMDEHLPERQAALIKGMAFGDKSALSGRERGVLSHSGVMHAFAVSGLHMGYVVIVVNLIFSLLRKRFKVPFLLRPVLVLAAVLFYGSVVGWTASVVRASVMSVFAALAWYFGRRHNHMTALLYAAVVCVILNPFAWEDVGFQLSFMATASLLLTAPLWKRLVRFDPLAFTIAPQLGVLPLITHYFSVFTLVGFVCSPVVVLGAGVVVAAVLISMLLAPLGLADIMLYGAGLLAELAYRLCEWLNGLPFAWLTTAQTPVWLVIVYYVMLGAALLFLCRAFPAGGEHNEG